MAFGFVAGATNSVAYTSTDGITWTSRGTMAGTTDQPQAIAYGNGRFVAVRDTGKTAYSTDAGATWTIGGVAGSSTPKDVTYGNGLFVAVYSSGVIYTSPDATAWTSQTHPFGAHSIDGVTYGNGLFVAVSNAGFNPSIATSPDGITWTSRTAVSTSNPKVAYGAGKYTTTGGNSPDGITWTSNPVLNGGAIANLTYDLGYFWAITPTSGVFRSADGSSWTSMSGTGASTGYDITAGSGLLAGATNNGIYTSPTGSVWTARGPAGVAIKCIAYAGNTPPNAPVPSTPADTAAIDWTITQRFGWAFSDPNVGDVQSKFDLRYRIVGAGSWIDVTGVTPNNFWDAPAATFTAGASYEWQVRTYDQIGDVGPYTSSRFFTAQDPTPTPTITDPISGSTIAGTATVTWSTPNQNAYQIRRVADAAGSPELGTIYYDTGTVNDPGVRSRVLTFDFNGRYEHVQVRTFYNGLWSPWASIRVNVSYTAPMTPVVTLTPVPEDGALDVSFVNPAPTAGVPAAVYNEVWIDDGLGAGWERHATMLGLNTTWRYWKPRSGVDYTPRVKVVTIADNATTSEGYPA